MSRWKWPSFLKAEWIAMDKDGRWVAFDNKPRQAENDRWCGSALLHTPTPICLHHPTKLSLLDFTPPVVGDWTRSLVQNPNSPNYKWEWKEWWNFDYVAMDKSGNWLGHYGTLIVPLFSDEWSNTSGTTIGILSIEYPPTAADWTKSVIANPKLQQKQLEQVVGYSGPIRVGDRFRWKDWPHEIKVIKLEINRWPNRDRDEPDRADVIHVDVIDGVPQDRTYTNDIMNFRKHVEKV